MPRSAGALTARGVSRPEGDIRKTRRSLADFSDGGPSTALPAFAGQRDLGTVIHVGGVATTIGATALRELAQTPEPLDFRLLVHDDSLAIGASWLDSLPSDVELGWFSCTRGGSPFPCQQIANQPILKRAQRISIRSL